MSITGFRPVITCCACSGTPHSTAILISVLTANHPRPLVKHLQHTVSPLPVRTLSPPSSPDTFPPFQSGHFPPPSCPDTFPPFLSGHFPPPPPPFLSGHFPPPSCPDTFPPLPVRTLSPPFLSG
ncbi:unnamed protein product, partial [Staurois parvus]